MFCSNCGKQVDNPGRCPYCGNVCESVQINAPAGNPQANYYSAQNGGNYNNFNNQQQNVSGGKKDNMFMLIMIAAGAVAVLLIVVALCFIFGVFGGNKAGFKSNSMQGDNSTVVDFYESMNKPNATQAPILTPSPSPTPKVKDASSYICVRGGGSWYDGAVMAAKYGNGAHLVTFDSIEEFHFVNALAKQNGIEYYWAGMQVTNLSDWENGGIDEAGNVFNKNNVVWLDGEPSGYDYALPFDEREFEDCLVVILKDGMWVANDAPGTTEYTSDKAGYIIELE